MVLAPSFNSCSAPTANVPPARPDEEGKPRRLAPGSSSDRDEIIKEQGYLCNGRLKPKTAPSGIFGSFHMHPP
jgi:hypothetical protein